MPTLREMQENLQEKQAQISAMLENGKTDKKNAQGGDVINWTDAMLAEFKDRNAELDALTIEFEAAYEAERVANEFKSRKPRNFDDAPAAPKPDPAQLKSVGEMFFESKGYKDRISKREIHAEIDGVDMKTLMSTSAGYAPANPRTSIQVVSAQRRPMVADVIPSDNTDLSVIKWMLETTFTNAADTVSEGGTKPESANVWTEQSANVQKIATWIPVTDEQLEDVPGMQSLINNRLMLMLMLTEEDQLLNGNGTPPDIRGFLNLSGLQTQAKGADNRQDAIYKAFTKIRATGFAEPTAVIINPNDWQDIRLATTADGIYLWGSPSEAGVERIWGKPVIVTTAITAGTALAGDFTMYSHLSRKGSVRVDVSNSHDDYFIKNKVAVRVEERISLESYRDSAFAQITGI